MTHQTTKAPYFKGALTSSGIMAFAGLGDAILYPILPVYAENLDIPIIWVGLALSINRFVRIISNTWIANRINEIGMKKTLIISAILAIITTFFYGLKLGLTSFIIARIIWGLSYSGLKISTLNYAANVDKNSGFTFGLTQSIKSIGALIALWLGPLLIQKFGVEYGLFIIAGLGSISLILAFSLPNLKQAPVSKIQTTKTFSFTSINLLIALLAIAIDGILVVVLATLLAPSAITTAQLLTLVASYLLLKRLAMAGVSLISGVISLKIKPLKLFNTAVIICIFALLLITFNFTIIGTIVAFIANAVVITFSPLIAIEQNATKTTTLQTISSVSTWWDLGAGLGAFLGIVLIQSIGQYYLFLTLALLIIVLYLNFIIENGKTNRTTI